MRQTLTIFCILIAFGVRAEMYFNPGTTWETQYIAHEPGMQDLLVSTILTEANDPNPELALGFYSNHSGDYILDAYAKVDDDKVYIRSVDESDTEWYLLYDFGLNPGEGNYFYMPLGFPFKGNAVMSYLRCNSITKDESFGDWDVMMMEEFKDEDCVESYGEGIWIKGLSAERSVLMNMYFEAIGGYSYLTAVYSNGDEIYKSNRTAVESLANEIDVVVNGVCIKIPECRSNAKGIIYTVDGKAVQEFTVGENTEIKLQSPGIYILKIGDCRRIIKI